MLQAADLSTRFNTVRKYVDGSFRNQYFLVSASYQCLVVLSFQFSTHAMFLSRLHKAQCLRASLHVWWLFSICACHFECPNKDTKRLRGGGGGVFLITRKRKDSYY